MALAGYACSVYRSGTPTATTGEACSAVTGNIYQITSSAKRVIDPRVAWHFKDGATSMAYSNILALDFQFGQVTFAAAPTTALTFSGTYLPITTSNEVLSEARSFAIDQSNKLLDSTVFAGAFGSPVTVPIVKSRLGSLIDSAVKVDTIVRLSTMSDLQSYMDQGSLMVIDIGMGASSLRFRAFCKVESISNDEQVDDLLKTSIGFKISSEKDTSVSTLFTGYSWKTQ